MMPRLELDGLGAAKGLVIGHAHVRYPMHFEIEHGQIDAKQIASELAKFEHALAFARQELSQLSERLSGALSKDIAELVHAHRLILDDPEFSGAIALRIRREKRSASAALKLQRDELVALFDAMEDPYLRSRREDVDQVALRLYNALKHGGNSRAQQGQEKPIGVLGQGFLERRNANKRPAKIEILVCETIAPDELANAFEHGLRALVLTGGSVYSHTAILARSLNLVLVCGIQEAFLRIRERDDVLIDGDAGRVIVHPDVLDRRRAVAHARTQTQSRAREGSISTAPLFAPDGNEIELHVNAERVDDIKRAIKLGAKGVGLYRTEFLYLGRRDAPTEQEQFKTYRDAIKAARGRPITFRTLDLGADKAAHAALELAPETNPALGLRGIRHSLTRRDLFETQLRALLRASAFGPMRILLPMISNADELLSVRKMLDAQKRELARKKIKFAHDIALGAMIEIPAAALIIDELATQADFFAIGSNDLAQYLLAADRNNDAVASWYQPDHPALQRLLKMIVVSAKKHHKPVSLCGEIASDSRYFSKLVGLGIYHLSMHVSSLQSVYAQADQSRVDQAKG